MKLFKNIFSKFGAVGGILGISMVFFGACGGGGGGGTSAGNPAAKAVAITPAIDAARVKGVAPLSVFFDASATTAISTVAPFHDLQYKWTFGDTSSGVWAQGSTTTSSKNIAYGPVASHVYDKPGLYTVNLDVNDQAEVATNTVQIEVQDPDEVFKNNTVCFSTTTSFVDCPSGAAQVTTSDFGIAINTYQSAKKRLLFKAGDQFSTSTQASVNTAGPGIIGKFGSGNSPRFISTAPGTQGSPAVFFALSQNTTPSIKDWRIMDLELDGQDRDIFAFNFSGGIDQLTLYRINMHNIDAGLNNSPSLLDGWNTHTNVNYHGHTLWDQFAVIDSQIKNINSGIAIGGNIGAYISGTRHSMMGCTIDSAGGGEHGVRNPYLDRAVISNNLMARPAASKHSWTLRGADQAIFGKLVGNGMSTQKVVAAENTFYSNISDWIVTVAPQNTLVDERLKDIIVERNYFWAGSVVQAALVTRGSVTNLTIRNNIFNLTGTNASSSGVLASGSSDMTVLPPPSTGHKIYNNTFYRGDPASSFTALRFGSNANNYAVKNNLAYAPNANSAAMLSGAIDSGLTASNNSADSDIKLNSPQFSTVPSNSDTLKETDFQISASSKAAGAATLVPLFIDLHQKQRSLTTLDLGAVNR